MSLLFFRETNVWMCTYLYKKTLSSPSLFLFKLAITTCFLNIHVDLCDISLFKSRCVYSNNKASNKARVCFSLPIHSLLESYSLQLWSSHSLFLFGSKVCGFWRENPLYLFSIWRLYPGPIWLVYLCWRENNTVYPSPPYLSLSASAVHKPV